MSAIFAGPETIDAVVAFRMRAVDPMSLETANAYGRKLLLLNALAMEARYGTPVSDYLDEIAQYEWKPPRVPCLITWMKCVIFWLYQCLEGDVSKTALYVSVKDMAEHNAHLTKHPKYDAAPWGLCGDIDTSAVWRA